MTLGKVAYGYGAYSASYQQHDKAEGAGTASKVKLEQPVEEDTEELPDIPLSEMSRQDMMDYIRQRGRAIFEKLQNGDTEVKFQIGGAEFSEKEWEKILKRVDDAIQAMKKEDEAEQEEQKETGEAGKKDTKLDIAEALAEEIQQSRRQCNSTLLNRTEEEEAAERLKSAQASMAVNERLEEETHHITDILEKQVQAEMEASIKTQKTEVISQSRSAEEDKVWYVTCYTSKGISCKSSEQGLNDQPLWEIAFQEDDYQKVMDFLNRFEGNDDTTFAASKDFWEDFLAGDIDEAGERELCIKYGKATNQQSFYDELFANTADGVREAWFAAGEQCGADGSAMSEDGKLSHISQIIAERLFGNHADYSTILGTTVQSAHDFAQRAVLSLQEELGNSSSATMNRAGKERELEFYKSFLEKLSSM